MAKAGNVAGSTLAGAGSGALIGSAFGPVGTGIGAGLGAGFGFLTSGGLGGGPGQGYNTAAQGAQQASEGYGDLANTQWNNQMGGLQGALGQYQPSNSYWYNLYGSQGPGQMESWYQQNQNYLDPYKNPSSMSDVYRQYGAAAFQPTASQVTGQSLAHGMLGGPTATQGAYDQYRNQLSGPSATSQAYNPSAYNMPGAAERFAQGQGQQDLGSAGALENWYGYHNGEFGQQNRTSNTALQANATLGDANQFKTLGLNYRPTNNLSTFAGNLPYAQGTNNINANAGKIGDYYGGANDVSQYAGSQMGQLNGPGIYEQFVQSDIAGNNPLMQRETDQGLARINQEMARRGAFKSGGADTAIGNFLGEMAAQDYQNRANRAQTAQGMQLNRIGAGQSLAGASAASKLAQGQAFQGLAGQMDQNQLARLQQQLQAQEGASGEGLANSAQRLGYAQAADQTQLARLGQMMANSSMADQQGLANLNAAATAAGGAQSAQLGRTTALGGLMNTAQQSELARLQGQLAGAGATDAAELARINAGYSQAQGLDAANNARGAQLFGMAQGQDAADLARWGQLGSFAGANDATRLAMLNAGGQFANQAQQAQQGRMNQAFASRFGLDNAMAGQYNPFYSNAGQFYGDAQGNSLNALANYYQLLGQGQGADNAMPFQLAQLGIQGYGALNNPRRG